MDITVDITESSYARLEARVRKAAARAPASGLPKPRIEKARSYHREYSIHDPLARLKGADEDMRTVRVAMTTVRLSDFAPQVGEWSVDGYRYSPRAGARPVDTATGRIPAHISGRDLCCDHCGFDRKRKETFVLRNTGSGQVREVGASCADAFFGGHGLAAGLSEWGSILREAELAGQSDPLSFPFDAIEEARTVLAFAHREVSENGFVSSAEARNLGSAPTWRTVFEALARYRSGRDAAESMTAADFMAADDIAGSLLSGEAATDFAAAARSAVTAGLAAQRDVAVLVAAAAIWIRQRERDMEASAARREAEGSVHVAAPGERIDFVGKVRSIASFDGRYGPTHYVTITDPDGNLFHWRASSLNGIRAGRAYEMRGTVKEHRSCAKGSYEGLAETVLSRVAAVADLGPFARGIGQTASGMASEDEEALDTLFSGMGGL